jgi:hypothetical protein
MTVQQRRVELILEAQQPIAHHAETLGNTSVLMRERVRQPSGVWASVPVVTGDSMRHGLREAASMATLDAAGLLGEKLSESALVLLFAGGTIGGSPGSSTKLSEYREMVDLIPHLSLLGGCAQNRSIPGRVVVDPARLVCQETEHLLPGWVVDWARTERGSLNSCRAHVEEEQRVRMDPRLDPGKRQLLAAGERAGIEQRLLASETASEEGDAAGKDAAKSSMMPRRYEVVAAGSLFSWSVTATCYSVLDEDTLWVMLATFLRDARVGGKRATGHGLLRAVAARNVTLAPFSDRSDTLDVQAMRVGDLFRAHVSERADRIKSFLGSVIA